MLGDSDSTLVDSRLEASTGCAPPGPGAPLPPRNLDAVLAQFLLLHPDGDTALIRRAHDFARQAHGDALRRDGHPYFSHPLDVAYMCAAYHLDDMAIACAFLHDVVEDTGVSLAEIRVQFGETAEKIVDGLTKLGKGAKEDFAARQVGTLQKLLQAAFYADPRILLVKVFDRHNNIQSLEVFRKQKQNRIAWETLRFYIPMTKRMGLYDIGMEMADNALRYIRPQEYQRIASVLRGLSDIRRPDAQALVAEVREELGRRAIPAQLRLFHKWVYELYSMLRAERRSVDQVSELVSFNLEVCVEDALQCYSALGALHHLYPHIPEELRDFVHNPKVNAYRSIHTTVDRRGFRVLSLLRTPEMAEAARLGIIGEINRGNRDVLPFLQDLVESGDGMLGADLLDLTQGIYFPEIDVFTPDGEALKLPEGSTVIDFAYRIHTEIGNHATGAQVDGQRRSLTTVLRSGEKVEVLTSDAPTVKPEWLQHARTDTARVKIIAHLREQDKVAPTRGLAYLARWLSKYAIEIDDREPRWEAMARQMGWESLAAMCRDIEYGRLFCPPVYHEMLPLFTAEELRATSKSLLEHGGLANPGEVPAALAEGSPQRLAEALRLAVGEQLGSMFPRSEEVELVGIRYPMPIVVKSCCSPRPPDEVVAITARGRGAALHRRACRHVRPYEQLRLRNLVDARWRQVAPQRRIVLSLAGRDRHGLGREICAVLAESLANIIAIHLEVPSFGRFIGRVRAEVFAEQAVGEVVSKLQRLPGIEKVTVRDQ